MLCMGMLTHFSASISLLHGRQQKNDQWNKETEGGKKKEKLSSDLL